MFALHGNGVGVGIAIGSVRVIYRAGDELPRYQLAAAEVAKEVARLRRAIGQAADKLEVLADTVADDAAEVSAILSAHAMMLTDPVLSVEPARRIESEQINAEAALSDYAKELENAFNDLDDPYISGKSVDIVQVVDRILGELLGAGDIFADEPEGAFDGEIIVANDLAPADAVELKKHQIKAFVTSFGGPISHTAILARSMKIPAIVGLHGGTRLLKTGDLVIIDGRRGVVLVNPDQAALDAYQRRREKIFRRYQELDSLRTAESSTLDGVHVSLASNIELPEEVAESLRQNADGVGLYRTEFLFMNRQAEPDEQEQYQAYSDVLRATDRPVTIRTLDLGADKQVDGGRADSKIITNPALGRRALRLCLHELSLFKPQLRAIYRASVHGQARLMIPMISNVDELDQLFVLLDEVRQELTAQGYAIDSDIPIGGMVEVPAAAVAADLFAERLDFLSIGTNDLVQYTLAIDRTDDEVNYLYDPLHPSILRLIKLTLEAGRSANIPVSMCGEMAGDVRYTRVLLAMGLREFSMDPAAIPEVKRQIRLTDIKNISGKVQQLLKTTDQKQMRRLVAEINMDSAIRENRISSEPPYAPQSH